jgi:Kef-type K+ transport system membrane component KefB
MIISFTYPLYFLITLAVVLFSSMVMAKIVSFFRLPAVTGYLIAGILIGPYCLGLLGINGLGFPSNGIVSVSDVKIFSDIALGFIAFGIGNEFKFSELKQTGKQALVIGFTQALAATICVDVVLIVLSFFLPDDVLSLPTAITLGAIATATAPAATVLVLNQYHARGPVTSILLPVVALDDAIGLVVYSISKGIADAIDGGEISLFKLIIDPLCDVVASLLLGLLVGLLLSFFCRKFIKINTDRRILAIAAVLLCVAFTKSGAIELSLGPIEFSFSSLLVCMMLGATFVNLCPFASRENDHSGIISGTADKWALPITVIFFCISGADFDLSVFTKPLVILVGMVYVLTRVVGKYFGAKFGAAVTNCPATVQKYLGITLFPQAGVALGMALSCGGEVLDITLLGVMIYELVAPVLTKNALAAAGEIPDEYLDKKVKSK